MYWRFVTFRFWISLIGVLLFIQSGIAEEDFRTWTSSDGKKLEAKYLRKIGEKIKIVNSSGKEFTVPLSRFSKEDQQYVLDAPTRDSFSLPEPFHDGKKGAVIIASVKGTVEVYDHLLDQKEPAKVGSILTSPKTLITGNDGGSVIIFTNGTSANIGANTKLFFQKIWQQEFKATPFNVAQIKEETSPCRIAMELKSGDLVVDVKKLKKSSSFHIHSPFLAAGIRGTRFGFSATNDYSNLGVLEGEVVVLDAQRKIVGLKDKQKVDAAQTGASAVSTMTREQEASVKESVDSIQRVTTEYKISQLEQVMLSQNKKPSHQNAPKVQSIPKEKDDLSKDIWNKKYDGWLKNPLPYGGIDTLRTIKKAHEENQSMLSHGNHLMRKKITDLEPLSTLSSLATLDLRSNSITDVSPLSGLVKLQYLDLRYNKIKDIKPLSSLQNLETLFISNNYIDDLSPLFKLYRLKTLDINCSNLANPKSLGEIEQLETLSVRDVKSPIMLREILNLRNLRRLSLKSTGGKSIFNGQRNLFNGLFSGNLEHLDVTEIPITYSDLKQFSDHVPNLKTLSLFRTGISNIRPLTTLKYLENLSIYEDDFYDIQPIGALTNLTSLSIKTKSPSLAPLLKLKKLETLTLQNVNFSHLNTLAQLKNLKKLILHNHKMNSSQKEALKRALPKTEIRL